MLYRIESRAVVVAELSIVICQGARLHYFLLIYQNDKSKLIPKT